MKINLPTTFGSILGWFVVMPFIETIINILFFPIPFIERTPMESLEYSIAGICFAIFLGLAWGLWEDLIEAREKHNKMMREYRRTMEKLIKINEEKKMKYRGKQNGRQ